MKGWPENCGADLDGDVFLYNGQMVIISQRDIWHEGYSAGYKAAIEEVMRMLKKEESK